MKDFEEILEQITELTMDEAANIEDAVYKGDSVELGRIIFRILERSPEPGNGPEVSISGGFHPACDEEHYLADRAERRADIRHYQLNGY